MKNQLIILSFFLIFCSCVPSKKYASLEADYQEAKISANSNRSLVERLETENTRLETEVIDLKEKINELRNSHRQNQYAQNDEVKRWQQKYEDLERRYLELQNNSAMEAQRHRERLKAQEQELGQVNSGQPNPDSQMSLPEININNHINTPNPENQNQTQNPQDYRYGSNNTASSASQLNKNENNKTFNENNGAANTNTSSSGNINRLYSLQNQLMSSLNTYSKEQISYSLVNGRLYVEIQDALLFQANTFELSAQGKDILSRVSQTMRAEAGSSLLIEAQPNESGEKNLGLLKAQPIAQYLNQQGVTYQLHERNFIPLAFDTSGTQSKSPKTYLILGVQ